MGNGCTMDWYGEGSDRTLNNGDVHVFMHGHVTSGASDSCRDSTRLSELISEHDGSVAVNVTDLDNAVGWEFTK
jgi:hypothetical protein